MAIKNKKDKNNEILNEMFRRAFDASTPRGDWGELLEKAEINKEGQKVIPFNDYICPHEKLEDIFNSVIKEYKVPKHLISAFSFSFWLGPSPKSEYKINHERKEISGV